MLAAIERVRTAAAARGGVIGVFANDRDFASQMAAAGSQAISIGSDTGWLASMARQMLPR